AISAGAIAGHTRANATITVSSTVPAARRPDTPRATEPRATDPRATDPRATDPNPTARSRIDPHPRVGDEQQAVGEPRADQDGERRRHRHRGEQREVGPERGVDGRGRHPGPR